jgi:hypothetical protein
MSTEDKVRDALADLAPLVPAGDEALAGVRRAITRRRRRRTAVRVTVAAGLLVAVAAAGLLASVGGEDGTNISETPPSPTTSTTEPLSRTVDGRVTFGPVSLELPDGWAVIEDGEQGQGGAWMCIAPVLNPDPKLDNCSGLIVRYGYLPGREMETYAETRQDWAWNHATDVIACPATQDVEDSVVTGPEGGAPIDQGFAPVGDKTAEYTQWAAECTRSLTPYTPRMWVLPETEVMIEDFFNLDETEDILASFEFTEE